MDASQALAAAPAPPKALPLEQEPAAPSDSQRDASTTALSGGGAAGVGGAPSALDADAAAALQNVIKSMDGISPEAQLHLLQVVGGLAAAATPGEADSADKNNPSPVASATTSMPAQRPALPGASGDAGSGCFLADAAAPAAAPAPAGGEELPDTAFAFVSQDRPLTPPGILTPVGGGLGLAGAPSLVTYKTKALAAAAGLVRCGPVGRSLRLAGAMCRSSSGSLADTLLSEAARAQSGLLTAALPRCDSLPELMAGATTCDLTDLPSLDFGFSIGLGTMELPSLTMLFDQQQAPAAPAAAPQQQQQQQGQAAAAAALAAAEEDAAPAWAAGPRVLGRPASFSAHSVTALFASSQPPLRPHMALAGGEIADGTASPHPALRPPQLLAPPSEMIVLSDATPNPAAPAAPAAGLGGAQHVSAFAGRALPAAPPPAGGWGGQPPPAAFEPAGAQPYYGRAAALPMMMERQDTFDVLLRQVDAELTAEAELRQYAALEFDTMELDAKLPPAAASAGPSATSFTSLGGMPAPSGGSAAGLAAQGWQQPKRRSVFEVSTLAPGGGLMGDPASCYGWPASSGGSLSGSGAPALSGPSPFCMSTGGAAVPLPRAEPSVTAPAGFGLPGAAAAPRAAPRRAARGGRGAGAAARGGAAGGGGAATGNGVEVARYSRVITCKTYLKRLNITQPMAEHLLPYHDLNASSSGTATTGGGGGDSPNSRKGGSYEALFKEEISLADSSGASFRVTYEGVSCNAQKHLRLTSGWRDFIRAHDVAVGDSIVFERRGDERRVLHVTVVKGAGADALVRDDEDEAMPATKKRRVARSKAVQRLA